MSRLGTILSWIFSLEARGDAEPIKRHSRRSVVWMIFRTSLPLNYDGAREICGTSTSGYGGVT